MFAILHTPRLRGLPQGVAPFAMVIVTFLGFLGSDMYLPLMPRMMHDLQTTPHWMQFTVSAYFLGLVSMQLVLGPLSDFIGRRPVVLFGLMAMLCGNWIDACTTHIGLFTLGRFIAGVGMAGGIALARIVARDCYEGKALAKAMSWFALAVGLSPLIAPVLGGMIGHYWGWHAIFAFMAGLYAALFGVYLWAFPETLVTYLPLEWRYFTDNLRALFTDRVFICASVMTSLMFTAYMAFVTAAPFVFQHHFHMGLRQYIWISLGLSLANVLGKVSNVLLLRRWKVQSIIRSMLCGLLLGSVGLACQVLYLPEVGWCLMWMMLFIFSFSTMGPNISATALNHAGAASVGVAGALYGTIQMLGSFMGSAAASVMADQGLLALVIIWVVVAAAVQSLFWWGRL